MRTPFKMKQFWKEIGLVILIIVTSILPYFNVLFSEALRNSINVFGFEISHTHYNNQAVFHSLFNRILMIVFPLILFKVSNRRFRYAVLFLLYWNLYRLFWVFSNEDFLAQNTLLFQCIAMALVLLLLVRFSVADRKIIMVFEGVVKKGKTNKLDFLIAFLILAVTIIQRLIFDFPFDDDSFHFMGFEISDHGFQSTRTFLWILSHKLSMLTVVSVCYFTQMKWWRYALLFPILLFIYEVRNVLNPDTEFMLEHEIMEAFPLLFGVLLLLVFLSRAAYFQSKAAAIYQSTYQRIEAAVKNRMVGNEKRMVADSEEKFTELKKGNAQSLKELEELKRTLSNALRKSDNSKKSF